MKYYYLYEIKVNNPESSFDQCYYYGKHITSNLNDGYMGSGKKLENYKNKYGLKGLQKTILIFYENEQDLDKAEYELIQNKMKELNDKCLNLNEGGHGSFSYINKTLTPEQKHKNAMIGGLANKKKLENPEEAEKWRQKVIEIHRNMTKEEKEERYSKVSNSLKEYYQTEEGQKELQQRNLKNKESNIKAAAEWRELFKKLFRGKQPESFRKYGKQKESHTLFKEIKELDEKTQKEKVDEFFKSIENLK